ncbi:hypothetical protein E8E13_003144 [Curvularia kusanoi]|uniref:Uncharacterized protein n=1 Tax=Curvularia kusanoi TaxID=90978 RepID=A0A9P4TFI3_CURKU|nr:hypothetical protein E8E13_003144 [Curvularia kusanoi]
MTHDHSRLSSGGRVEEDTELWFNMPSLHRQHQHEQSAYRATSDRLSWGSSSATSSRAPLSVPRISTPLDVNKSLPPPPPLSERKRSKQATLRSLLRGQPTGNNPGPSYLQPESSTHHQRNRSAGGLLSVDLGGYHQQQSRSMPSSPYGHDYSSTPFQLPPLARAQSVNPPPHRAASYHPYDPSQEYTTPASSLDAPFEPSPTRARTFPETTVASPTTRNDTTKKPRPHTWLSPTEPFADPSQFHLFVEATTGLPDDSDPWSPNGPNRLQSSLFARRSSNGAVPVPPQYAPAPIPDRTHQTAVWQSFEPPMTSSRSVSAPMSSTAGPETPQQYHENLMPHINAVNAELGMLGLDGDLSAEDDELPDYAQSQAEMNAKKRTEAAARARELEARWQGARGRRS